MPGKRKSGGKTPHVNIGYVLDQPPAAIAQAINALRERPYPLAASEAKGVAKELPRLLKIIADAIPTAAAQDVVPAAVALALDGLSFSPDVEAAAVKNVAGNGGAMGALVDLFDFALVRQAVSVEVQIDVAELFNFFSDADATKDAIGERFMEPLADLVARPQQHFALHRELCSNLIALVKCSKANKLRLPCYSPVVQALVTTTDFFLQLQCVELLYRVSRQHPRLLDKVQAELPEMLFTGIRALPNSADLFDRMCDLVTAWNRTRTPRLVMDFAVEHVDVADERYTAKTTVFFSPKIFMLLLPNTAANNVSVEYTTIRSVKMRTSDGGLCIRLREPPASIADKLEIGSEGKDCIVLKFTDAARQEFRDSKIRQWIYEMTEQARQASSNSAAKMLLSTGRKSLDVAAGGSSGGRTSARNSGGAGGDRSADGKGVAYHSHNHRVASATSMVLASQQIASQDTPGGASPLGAAHQQRLSEGLDGATPPVPDYYPMPQGSRIARPLDMNTPAHPDALDARYGTAKAAAKSTGKKVSIGGESVSKRELAAMTHHHDADDGIVDAPAAAAPTDTSAASSSTSATSRGGLRRPRETETPADAPAPRDTAHRPPSDKKHCREIELGSLALDDTAAPAAVTAAPAAATVASSTTPAMELVDIFNMASPTPGRGAGVREPSRHPAGGSRPASQATSDAGDIAGVGRNVLQRAPLPLAADVGGASPGGMPLDDLLTALQHAAEERTAAQRREAEEAVTRCLSTVQDTVSQGRRTMQSDIGGFESYVGDHVDMMRAAHRKIEDQLDVAVRELNGKLGDVRDKRRTVVDSLACLEGEFGQHAARLRGREEEVLRQLKRHVESEMSRLARTADDQLRTEPLRALRSASVAQQQQQHTYAGAQQQPTRHSSTTRSELVL